jgi:hypothetical protein
LYPLNAGGSPLELEGVNRPLVEYADVETGVFLEADLNDVPKRQKFSGAAQG